MRFAPMVLLGALGCALAWRPPPVEPDVTFAAHRARGGFVIDRLAPGRRGTLRPPGWLRTRGAPTFVLESERQRLAAVRVASLSHVSVHGPQNDERAGAVDASWEDGAIRLTLVPAGGSPLRSDRFAREGGGVGPDALSRTARTVLDVRGTYRATLRDEGGAPVGWLRVRISPYAESPRIYDGVLPAALPDGLAAAAVVLLDGEIDWIEGHAIDVYRGTGGAALEQSVPLPR